MGKKGLWFLARAVATLVLIGLVVGGGFALYYIGWSQGQAVEQTAVEGEKAETSPYLPHGWGHPGWHVYSGYHPFGMLGMLLKIALCILFFGLVFKLIRFVIWGPRWRFAMHGPWARGWHMRPGMRAHRHYRRWHRMHGPIPPWCWDWDEDQEDEETEDSESKE